MYVLRGDPFNLFVYLEGEDKLGVVLFHIVSSRVESCCIMLSRVVLSRVMLLC